MRVLEKGKSSEFCGKNNLEKDAIKYDKISLKYYTNDKHLTEISLKRQPIELF